LPFHSLPITGKKGAGEGREKPINIGSGGVAEQLEAMLWSRAGAWRLLQIVPSVMLCMLGKSLAATRDRRDLSFPSFVYLPPKSGADVCRQVLEMGGHPLKPTTAPLTVRVRGEQPSLAPVCRLSQGQAAFMPEPAGRSLWSI